MIRHTLCPGGFYPENKIQGEHVLFLASFNSNDATLSQFHVLNMLCESFIESLVSCPHLRPLPAS